MSETILSVERALDLLLLMYRNGHGMGVSEIGRELDLHKSTVHRILATLEKKGFVYKDEKDEKYWFGLKIYAMGLLIGEKLSLAEIIRPFAKKLFEDFGEVVNASILDRDPEGGYRSIIILKESENDKVLSVNPNVGSSTEPYSSSLGKCLLAYNSEIDWDELSGMEFRKHTPSTIDNYEDLVKELIETREKGYAIDNEEQELGLYCIGAPILDRTGEAVAAISISGPTARMKNDKIQEKINRLLEIANLISKEVIQIR